MREGRRKGRSERGEKEGEGRRKRKKRGREGKKEKGGGRGKLTTVVFHRLVAKVLTLSHSTMFSSFSLSADVSRISRRVRWVLWYLINTSLF